jgi:hypothetical protein
MSPKATPKQEKCLRVIDMVKYWTQNYAMITRQIRAIVRCVKWRELITRKVLFKSKTFWGMDRCGAPTGF